MKSIEEHFRDWESFVFGFGYGSGERHILSSLKIFFSNIPVEGNYDYCGLEVACGDSTAWLLINILCKNDIIEYGTSPRFGWLTKQGKELKTFIDQNDIDALTEICTGYGPDVDICYPELCNCGPEGYSKVKLCHNPFWKEQPFNS